MMKSIILLVLTFGYVENDGIERLHRASDICSQNSINMVLYYDKSDDRIALFFHPYNNIYINVGHPYWINPEQNRKKSLKLGLYSTDNEDHIILHEVGHAVLHRKIGSDRFNRLGIEHIKANVDEKIIIKEVGKYACKDALEFFSEVYVGLLSGRKYSNDIMKAYNELWNL